MKLVRTLTHINGALLPLHLSHLISVALATLETRPFGLFASWQSFVSFVTSGRHCAANVCRGVSSLEEKIGEHEERRGCRRGARRAETRDEHWAEARERSIAEKSRAERSERASESRVQKRANERSE